MLFVSNDSCSAVVGQSGQGETPSVGQWGFRSVQEDVARGVQGKIIFGERGCIAVPQ